MVYKTKKYGQLINDRNYYKYLISLIIITNYMLKLIKNIKNNPLQKTLKNLAKCILFSSNSI